MFTEEQIKAAHSKVKTGADFPAYVQEIKALGLVQYRFWVTDGHTTYYGENKYCIDGAPRFPVQDIADKSSSSLLQKFLKLHQQGQSDFMTFLAQAASTGVEFWEVNTQTMLCTYFDKLGNVLLEEEIPQVYSKTTKPRK